MQQDVSDIISRQFTHTLESLRNIMVKAQEHAKERKFDENLYLDMKLAPDMLNFTKQVQITCDTAKFAVARLSGKTGPVFDDNEKTMAELISRVGKTLEYVHGFKKEDFTNYKDVTVSFAWNPGATIKGEDYLSTMAVPNFYFHTSMAYALLRHAGVNIGKMDYLGKLNWI